MKFRAGFVSNSSSSSFVLDATKLTVEQLAKVINHAEEGDNDAWRVEVKGTIVLLGTSMDNFDMDEFLEKIGVADDAIVSRFKN